MRQTRRPLTWVLFPIEGLIITDEDAGISDPMFRDATVISVAGVKQLVNETEVPYRDAAFQVVTRSIADRSPHSFIAVSYPTPKQSEHVKHCVQNASQRARCIVATLATVLPLIIPGGPNTCALIEDIRWQLSSYSTVTPDTSQWSFSGHTRMPLFYTVGTLPKSRKELQELVFQEELSGLTKTLLLKNKSPLSDKLEKAVLRLYEAMLALDHSEGLLAAVTTLELLLTSGDYKVIEREVEALLGKEDAAYLETGKILTARNDYVHKAQKVASSDEHLRAVAVALMSLCRYANLGRIFNSSDEIIKYLRRISDIDAFVATVGPTEQTQLQYILEHEVRHKRQGYLLEWMQIPSTR